jgi:GxxExxY protein
MWDSLRKAEPWSGDVLILEFKAVQEILPIQEAQLLSYMKLLKKPLGLLFNFHELVLKNGVRRLVLKEALSS